MKITFNLDKDDLLQFQLFEASKSPMLKKKRNRNWFLIPIVYAASGGYIYHTKGDFKVLGAFLIAAVGWIALYPAYSRWLYRKQFERYIAKNFDTSEEKSYSLELGPETLDYFDGESEGNFIYKEIISMIELKNHFFITTEEQRTVIVPKLEQEDTIKEFMLELSAMSQKEIIQEQNWKWI